MSKITYTNKVTLNSQPSIADENKVTSGDMNEIKTVVNNNDDNVGDLTSLTTTNKTSIVNAINELKGGEIYSTSEVKTNKKWINGKPIYRKVVNVNSMFPNGITANSTNIMSYPIPNFETLTKAKLLRIGSNPVEVMGLCYIQYITLQGDIQIKVGNCTLSIGTGQNLQLVLEYTKTTD